MGNETMDLEQLAGYLQRDVREVGKLANRGHLPGQKVGGQWRFARAEINHWLETQLPEYGDAELTALERHHGASDDGPLISSLLSEATIAIPLPASTRASVLRELVTLAEQSWQVYDPAAILDAVRQREESASTALPSGVALPHPHRPLTMALGESVMAFGKTGAGIPYGSPEGGLTDLFFLVLCRDERTHMQVLARLSRLFLRPGFLDGLRAQENPHDCWSYLTDAEESLLA